MLFKVIKTYIIFFVVFFIGYSFLNWLLTAKTNLLKIDGLYSNLWIPLVLVYGLSYFILLPVVKQLGLRSVAKITMMWAILPLSIIFPTTFSQPYFADSTYQVIAVKNPEETLRYPEERFFAIKNYQVNANDFILYKKRSASSGKSPKLTVKNYYIAPIYTDTIQQLFKVAYGILYSTSFDNVRSYTDDNTQDIQAFNTQSSTSFAALNLHSPLFFKKQINSKDAVDFEAAWLQNQLLDAKATPVVLVGQYISYQQLIAKGKINAIYSIIACLIIALVLLLLFNYFKKKPTV